MFRKLLARIRNDVAKRGIVLSPMTARGTGGYSGFSLDWSGENGDRLVRGAVCKFAFAGHELRMFVTAERDLIQREHIHGRLYEPEELAMIGRHFAGGTFVDVGANVGNHAVYAGIVLGAARLILFEPNPEAARILEINLALNGLASRAQLHRVGLSDQAGTAQISVPIVNNLGSARISEGGAGVSLELMSGDDCLAGEERIDFIKIDAEGFEIKVLEGLSATIARFHPPVFVEVEDANRDQITALMQQYGYAVGESFSRYPGLTNMLFKRA